MALPIEQLYKARDFLNLKNISANHVELSFKNPVIAMLAKGKVAEIASQCSPDGAFTKCEMHGNDLHLDFNPEYVSERLMAEIFDAAPERARDAARELAAFVAEKPETAATSADPLPYRSRKQLPAEDSFFSSWFGRYPRF